MQDLLIYAIAVLVALASFCFVWFGIGLVMKLQSVASRPKVAATAPEAEKPH